MDEFFTIEPNNNHLNLAELARAGYIHEIITLNFDYGLERAFEAISGLQPNVCTTPGGAQEVRSASTFTIHKPHGSLREIDKNENLAKKFRSIRYTLQRIGTSYDEILATWLRTIIGSHAVLVTGYSNKDLDLFPAFLRTIEKKDVFWNFFDGDATPHAEEISSRCKRAGATFVPIIGDISEILVEIMRSMGLNSQIHAEIAEGSPKRLPSLELLSTDVIGISLATAMILQSTEARDQKELIDDLRRFLINSILAGGTPEEIRKRILITHFNAGVNHEKGNMAESTAGYFNTLKLLRDNPDVMDLGLELSMAEVETRLAYESAWILKRPSMSMMLHPIKLAMAFSGLLKLSRRSSKHDYETGTAGSALAAAFLGEIEFNMAMALDLACPGSWPARLIYKKAHSQYKRATQATKAFVPREMFHKMREVEVRMFVLLRRNDSKPSDLVDVDSTLEHFDYVNKVMGKDAAWGTLMMLATLRQALKIKLSDQGGLLTNEFLQDAKELYRKRNYPSGIAKIQLYEWLLLNRGEGCFRSLIAFPKRMRRLVEIRSGITT